MVRRSFFRLAGLTGGALLAGTPFRLMDALRRRDAVVCTERLFASLGTIVRFQVYHDNKQASLEAIGEAAKLIQRIHNLMSVQECTSQLARWNRSAAGLDEPLDALTASALDEALSLARHTGGRFDPTVGAAVAAYQRGDSAGEMADRIGGWDAANRRFEKTSPGIQLDLGGSAKGWAVDRAFDVLVSYGISAALINAGGDLRVLGSPPEALAWDIGIRDPRAPDNLLATLSLKDAAVATSGDYEVGSSLLVDPRDLSRVHLSGSVSVVAPTCGVADGWSTAFCVEQEFTLLPETCAAITARYTDSGFVVETTPGLNTGPY